MIRNDPKETKKLICLGIIYTDNDFGITLMKCKTLAFQIKNFYEKNSRNKLTISIDFNTVKVPYTATTQNAYIAEQFAKNRFKGYDFYAMIVSCIPQAHAGAGIAHLKGFLARTAIHEVGHLLKLGHSGSFKDGVFDEYGDTLSVMGKFPAAFLASPQYYFKNWIPQEEIIEYSPTIKNYRLKRLINFNDSGHSIVKIDKNIFVSYPQKTQYFQHPFLTIHLQFAGSTKKIKSFDKEFKYLDYHFKIIPDPNENEYINFTIDFLGHH